MSDETVPVEETASRRAPGPLALVQAFVNTRDVESGADEVPGGATLGAWLGDHGLSSGDRPVSEPEHARAIAVREAIRGLAEANAGERLTAEAARELDRIAADLRLAVRFDETGHAELRPVSAGVDGAMGRLLSIVYTAMAEGTWERFKACARHTCRWAYYDRSKNRSGSWCSMEVCGNREKAKAYRRRRGATSRG